MSTSGADLSEKKTEDPCSALEDELRDAPADQRAAYDEDDARTQIRVIDDQCAEASGPRTVKGRAADLRPARNEEVPVAAGPCADQEFRRESKLQPSGIMIVVDTVGEKITLEARNAATQKTKGAL